MNEPTALPPTPPVSFLEPGLEGYLLGLCPPTPGVLGELESQALHLDPLEVGPRVGRLLWQLACLKGARSIFEAGSGVGLATAWLALAVGEGGRVLHAENRPDLGERARGFLGRLGLAERVEYHVGDPLGTLERVDRLHDLVVVNLARVCDPEAFERAAPWVAPGGLLVGVRALAGGRVADDAAQDELARALRAYHRRSLEAPDFLQTLLPLEDGVSLAFRMR